MSETGIITLIFSVLGIFGALMTIAYYFGRTISSLRSAIDAMKEAIAASNEGIADLKGAIIIMREGLHIDNRDIVANERVHILESEGLHGRIEKLEAMVIGYSKRITVIETHCADMVKSCVRE